MADTSSLRNPSATIAEDDPFAELTRIIGFDPRVKVIPESQPEPDFGIDLERELMGDFGADEDTASVEASPAPQIAAPSSSSYTPAPEAAPVDSPAWKDFDPATDKQSFATLPAEASGEQGLEERLAFELGSETNAFAAEPSVEEPGEPISDATFTLEPEMEVQPDWQEPVSEEQSPLAAAELEEAFAQPAALFAEEPVLAADVAYDQSSLAGTHESSDEAEPLSSLSEDPAPAAASATFYDDELERAFAALEAWERGDAPRPSPESQQPEGEMLSVDPAMQSVAAPEELHEGDSVGDDLGARDQFTAEEGWTDDGVVSLDEPQVLQTEDSVSDHAAAAWVSPEQSAEATAAPVEADTPELAAFDNEFEQQLFDLLGADDALASGENDASNEDAWTDDLALNEALLAEDFDAGDETAVGSALEDEEPAQAFEPIVEPAMAPVLPAHAEPVAFRHVEEPRAAVDEPAGPAVQAREATAEDMPDSYPSDDPFLAELDLFELSLNELITEDAFSEPSEVAAFEPASRIADLQVDAAGPAPAFQHSDPVDDVSATPPVEPKPMQPFNERAFDAALAEELGFNDTQDTGWNNARGATSSAAAAGAVIGRYAPQTMQGRSHVKAPAMHADVPDIETVDFVDQRVAAADELDLPEVDYGREERRPAAFDDFDAEFASAFSALNEEPAAAPQAEEPKRVAAAPTAWDDNFDFGMAGGVAAGSAAAASASSLTRAGLYEPEEDDRYYEDAALRQQRHARPVQRRGLMLGGAVAALVLLGGVAYLALPMGGTGSGEPAIVRADADPLKVRPENPGGTVVPNQENAVYERVGSGQLSTPTQERLITSVEEPVDLAVNAPQDEFGPLDGLAALDGEEGEVGLGEDATGTVKAEDRIVPGETAGAESQIPEEMIAVAPRKVRTMVVRPDGTLVPREEAAPAPAPVEVASVAEAAISAEPAVAQPEPVAVLPDASTGEAPAVAAPAPQPEPQPAPQVAAVAPQPAPAAAPEPVAAAAAPSGWAVQIASQPSEASAKSSYDDLARRYASVLNGRGVNIVKADIAGKGTYYRVRIPAASRSEANSICSSYKSAGGNCFVSQ